MLARTAATTRSHRGASNGSTSRSPGSISASSLRRKSARARWRRVFTVPGELLGGFEIGAKRRLLDGQLLYLPEDEHGPEVIGQRVDGAPEEPAMLDVRGVLLGRSRLGSHFRFLLAGHGAQSAPPATERFVDGDARQPGGERRAAFEVAQVGVGVEISGLHGVLDLGLVAQDGADGAVEALVVTTHDQLEELGIAGQDAIDHLLVGPGLVLFQARGHRHGTPES